MNNYHCDKCGFSHASKDGSVCEYCGGSPIPKGFKKGDLRLVYEGGIFYTQHMSRSGTWVDKREHKPFCGQYWTESHLRNGILSTEVKIEIEKFVIWLKAERVRFEDNGIILSETVILRELPPEVAVIGEVVFPITLKTNRQTLGSTPNKMREDAAKQWQQKKEDEEAISLLPTDPEVIVRTILSKGRTRREIVRLTSSPYFENHLKKMIVATVNRNRYYDPYPQPEIVCATMQWLWEHIEKGHLVMPRKEEKE